MKGKKALSKWDGSNCFVVEISGNPADLDRVYLRIVLNSSRLHLPSTGIYKSALSHPVAQGTLGFMKSRRAFYQLCIPGFLVGLAVRARVCACMCVCGRVWGVCACVTGAGTQGFPTGQR